MKRALEPSLERLAAQIRRKASNHRLRNSDGTFKCFPRKSSNPRSAGSGTPPAPSAAKRSVVMESLRRIGREIRELLWPSDSAEMCIKRGYIDDRDQI